MSIAKNKMINRKDINEELRIVEGSDVDYITPSGKVYKQCGTDLFYLRKVYQNNYNKYMYVNITFKDGHTRNRRQHVLMAKAYIPNPDPIHLKIVGHKDDIKWHNTLNNLYWTTNQENCQSAIDHGLNVPRIAEDNDSARYVKVLDKNTLDTVGVYGSIRECARRIENVTISFISKMCNADMYKPRSRKYIYRFATEEEFNDNQELKGAELVENATVDKSPKVFYLINEELGYKEKFDNQVQASKVCNIPQATISHMLKHGESNNGWSCEYIDTITYKDASSYNNFINTYDNIVIENIYTGEKRTYKTWKALSDDFNLRGHSVKDYYKDGFIIQGEWKIIDLQKPA